jgi:hypothetical protein
MEKIEVNVSKKKEVGKEGKKMILKKLKAKTLSKIIQ